jgi:L-lactate dehydrogenase (cytochrome)
MSAAAATWTRLIAMSLDVIASIAGLRELACRRVPRAIFEYADRGSYDELTLQRNRADLQALELRQRAMVDLNCVTVSTTVLGQQWSLPVAIAPTGLTGLFWRDGEIQGARAAERVGVPFALSTMSICSIEDLRGAVKKPFWFRTYLMRDRGFNEELIARARAAECSALILTVDLTVQGVRRRDVKNGLCIPPRLTMKNMFDIARCPRWASSVLMGRRRTFGNLESHMKGTGGLQTLSQWIASQFDCSITWRDIEWVRSLWPRKLILKGILDANDARLAADSGVDAIVVSNHGGRQLDGAPSTISGLPEIADAIAGRCELLFDGVQSGQDVLKALARGARACLIGKAFLYALAAGGEAGVRRAFDIMRAELEVSMALAGVTDVRKVDRAVLRNA